MDFYGLIALILLLILVPVLAIAILFGNLAGYFAKVVVAGRQDQGKWENGVKYGTYLGIFIFFAYSVYTAFYPTDDFFLSEFKAVTLREPPESSKVVAKSASYPDFHGDYCSYSRIELSPVDYSTLLAEIETDTRLKREDPLGNLEEQVALRSMPTLTYETSFTRPDRDDHHFEIKFMDTGKHVDLSVCIT